MALTYSPVEIRGKAAEPVMAELFFQNKTVANNWVNFESEVKYNTIFTELANTITSQAYTAGAPTSQGGTALTDTLVTPVKLMYYAEFNPETLRPSRFNKTLAAGAWNILPNDFERVVLSTYSEQVSADAESKFWNSVTSASQTSIASLTGATTQEKALIAAKTADLVDGVVAHLIKDGSRISVSGTTITSSNIATEYGKLYAAIPGEVLDGVEAPVIYAPKSHIALINIYNANATYRDLFSKDGGKVFYNGIEIRFVQLSEKTLIAGIPTKFNWCTDLVGDESYMLIDKIASNRDDMFVKVVYTLASFVGNKKSVVLYQG